MKLIVISGQKINLNWVTGKVEEAGKNMETKIQGGGGGGFTYRGTGGTAPVSIKSRTVIHDQFFITDGSGGEHSFQLQNFNIACRSGNKLTVLWAVKEGSKSGPYIAVYNHSTSTAFYNNNAMATVFRRPVLYLIGAIVLLFFLGQAAPFFYWLIPMALIYWGVEGSMAVSRFKKEVNFNEFG